MERLEKKLHQKTLKKLHKFCKNDHFILNVLKDLRVTMNFLVLNIILLVSVFLEVCKSYQIVPDGLYVEKEPCIGNPSKKLLDAWKNQLEITRSSLRDVLLEEYVEKYFKLEAEFKSVFAKHIEQEDWLLKVRNHLERLEKKLHQKKFKKLHKFCKNDYFILNVLKDLRVTMNFLVLNIILLVSVFREVFKSYQIVPDGLHVEKEPCIGNAGKKFLDAWKNQLEITRSSLRDVLLEEYVGKYFKLEAEFKSVFAKHIVQEDWLLKVRNHLERLEKKLR